MAQSKNKRARRVQSANKKCFVYVLVSMANTSRTYVGVTDNLQRRLRQHNGVGGARYTKSFRPWRIHSIFQLLSRRDALSLEWNIKHRRRASDGKGVDGRVKTAVRIGDRYKGFKIIK